MAHNVEVERHIRQNNERLRCIQRHLQTTEGFERAAKELLEWCSDQRAFQKAFETSLMQCLTVISEVAAKPGFNLSLGYRLLAICSANHDKFSTKSSGMLRYWCEDLGKALLLQHQKNNRSNDGMKPPLSTNPSPGPHGGHMGMSYPPGPMGPRMGYNDPTVWNPNNPGPNHGPIPPRPQQPSLSVITTVWGVTNTTQTPPIRGQSMAPLNQYSQHMGPGSVPHPRPHSQGPGYVNNYMSKANSYSAPGHYARQDSYGAPMGGTHRGMHGSGYSPNAGGHQGHHDGSDYPPAAAAAAAAVAAAAATATATATATLIATDQQQQQQNDMYDQHAGNSMHPIDGNSMHAHGGNMAQRGMMRPEHGGHSDMMVPGNREPPRPNMPPQYTQINRGMGPGGPHSMGVPHHPNNSPMGSHNSAAFNHMSYRSQYRPTQNSYGHAAFHTNPMPPNQFKSPPLGGHPHTGQGGYNPSLPTPSSQGPPTPLLTATPDLYPSVSSAGAGIGSGFYPNPHHQTPNPSHPLPGPGHGYPQQRMGYNNQYNSMGYRSHPQHGQPQNPMPGNPTPPLTPGSVHNVPPYPGSDVKPPPSHLDVKPIIPNQDNEEMRMTFPVRDGIVLEPFRLEHNRSVSTHAFHLRPQAYQTLMWRSDLELQFKCYHHDDKMRCTNWPLSVQVKVNNRNMIIPRNPVSKPLYLREVCQSGRNAIEISVSTCCCSHLFVLQLVHRPSVRSVLMGLLQKRMLPAAHCVTKIKRYFSSGVISGNKSMLGSPIGPNDLDSNCVIVPLRCPITFKRINLPARGSECKHIQCFDLEAYLQLNSDKRTWKCPICKKSALLEGLEVDQYIWSILNQSHAEDMEVTIDQQCNWKSITVKQEHPYGDEQDGPPLKRIRTGMSPATMLNHLPSPGSYVPQMTPLPPARLTMTPDMNPGGPPGFPQSSGGCGFNGSNGNGMSNADGGMENYGITGVLSPNNPMPIPPMNVPDILGGPLHRANAMPMSQNDNIAANDMVTIKRRLNHAVANNNNNTNPNISSPRAMGHSNALQSSNAPPMPMSKCQTPQNSGLQSAMDPRVRTPISCTMSNLTPNTPGNPSTPGLGLSPSIISPPTTNNNNMNNSASNLGPVAPGNGLPPGINIKTEALNFDPTAIINDGVMGDNAENIPTLDILPENTDTLDLTDILGVDNSSSNDDILSLFDIQS